MLAKDIQDRKADIGQLMEEALQNIRTVKAFSTEAFELNRLIKVNADTYDIEK